MDKDVNGNIVLYNIDNVAIDSTYIESIYEECKKNIPLNASLDRLYDFFSIKANDKHVYKRCEIIDNIVERIVSTVQKGNIKKLKNECKKCRRKCFLYEHINIICYAINEALDKNIAYNIKSGDNKWDRNDWYKLLTNASYLTLLDGSLYNNIDDGKMFFYNHDISYVGSLKFMQEKFKLSSLIDREKEEIVIPLFKHLERSIKEFDAYIALQYLMHDLGRIYNIDEKRFQINEESGFIYPVLYHLILKVMTNQSNRASVSEKKVKWEEIKNLANHLIVLTDLRDNCYIQFHFPKIHDDYIERMMNYSGIFDVHQYNYLGVLFLVNCIIEDNSVKLSSTFGISKEQIKKYIYDFVQSADKHIKEGHVFLLNHLDINEEQKKFLNHMSTMEPVNKNYNSPYDWDKVDDDSVWLLKKDDAFYFLPNIIASWGIYDKICSMLDWLDNIGETVEKAVADLFYNYLHLNVKRGIFFLDKCKYESDGVIINDDFAIIIECKQKPLTRQARSGDSKKVLDDIACAYLYSQAQAFRIERAIRTADKYLYLYQDECKYAGKERDCNFNTQKKIIIDVSNVKRIIRLTCVCGNFWILSETGIIKHIEEQYINGEYDLPHKKEVECFFNERKKLLDIISNNKEKRIIGMNGLFLAFDKLHQIVIASKQKANIFDVFFKLSRIQSKQNDTMNHLSYIMNV